MTDKIDTNSADGYDEFNEIESLKADLIALKLFMKEQLFILKKSLKDTTINDDYSNKIFISNIHVYMAP